MSIIKWKYSYNHTVHHINAWVWHKLPMRFCKTMNSPLTSPTIRPTKSPSNSPSNSLTTSPSNCPTYIVLQIVLRICSQSFIVIPKRGRYWHTHIVHINTTSTSLQVNLHKKRNTFGIMKFLIFSNFKCDSRIARIANLIIVDNLTLLLM